MSKMGKMMGGAKAKGDQRTAQQILPSVEPTDEDPVIKVVQDVIPPAANKKRTRQGSVALGL